eukprot:gb/GEZN01004735.1/.p1 GENE.gb/GEZN01004735.1/~~gb/GEZN01004735.1/.p1  ORF type:complete len:504 (+),score=71.21 gb/GEZN01004735.1/:157-1512(+)
MVFVPLIFVCYVLLLCGQSWLAFRVRKLPTVFNESQLIAWLLYNTVFVGLVGIMVDFMLDWTQITAKMMVRAVALFLGSVTPVFVLYAPKLLEIYRDAMNDSKYSSGDKDASGSIRTAASGTNPGFDKLTGTQIGAFHNSSVVAQSGQRTGHQTHRSAKGSAVSGHSAISGLSDDGNQSDVNDGDLRSPWQIELVPDSDLAGDEHLYKVEAAGKSFLDAKYQPLGGESYRISTLPSQKSVRPMEEPRANSSGGLASRTANIFRTNSAGAAAVQPVVQDASASHSRTQSVGGVAVTVRPAAEALNTTTNIYRTNSLGGSARELASPPPLGAASSSSGDSPTRSHQKSNSRSASRKRGSTPTSEKAGRPKLKISNDGEFPLEHPQREFAQQEISSATRSPATEGLSPRTAFLQTQFVRISVAQDAQESNLPVDAEQSDEDDAEDVDEVQPPVI